jgi:hypothetical protein
VALLTELETDLLTGERLPDRLGQTLTAPTG